MTTTIDQTTAAATMQAAIARVLTTQTAAIAQAGRWYVDALDAGGLIHAFGTGHSRGFAMEVAGRAGGLVPTNMLAIKDIVMFGGGDPAPLMSSEAERDPATAHAILALANIHPADLFMVASNSGGNGSTVEMAIEARRRGHRVIAVTSLQHSTAVQSRHPGGQRLFEVADLVIDNCSVYGDAEVPLPGGGAIVPTSAVTASLIAEMIAAEACGILLARGETPPVYLSANIPEGDAHNTAIRERYGDRIRRAES